MPAVSPSLEQLDGTRALYLVYRFLLESGLTSTVAALEREWMSQPHRHLPYARYVRDHSLIILLKKGLLYSAFEREAEKIDAPAAADAPSLGFFGPLVFEPPTNEEEDQESDLEPEFEDAENPLKRHISGQPSLSIASPAKRPRLDENGASTRDIDHAAYPSPYEGEGEQQVEKATQVDIPELQASFLPVGEAMVLLCEWGSGDSVLAAGTDALARIWTIAQTPDSALDDVDGRSRAFKDLVEDDLPVNAVMTAMAWNWERNAVAIAVEVGQKARINVWAADGSYIHRFDGQEPPVTKLRWCPRDNGILAIGPENRGTLVSVFNTSSASSMSYFLAHNHYADPIEATWITETEFVICGGDLLVSLRCTPDGIVPGRQFQTHDGEAFNQVQFDWRSKILATSSDKGKIDLWDERGQRRCISAHRDMIVCLQWQPLQTDAPDDERLLVSGGEDGAVCFWNVRNLDNKPKYTITMDGPILALSMTPDGAFIATATSDRVLIWKPGDPFPRASWATGGHAAKGDSEEIDTVSLSWDATGQRLVYSWNSQLAIITFR